MEGEHLPQNAKNFNQEGNLLALLLGDGRTSYQGLAEKLETYRQDVWRRMQSLEKSTIWGYKAVIDFRALGWQRHVIHVPLSRTPEPGVLQRLTDTLSDEEAQGPNLFVIDAFFTRAADLTLQVSVAAANSLVLHSLMEQLTSFFGSDAGEVTSHEVLKPLILGGFSAPANDAGPEDVTAGLPRLNAREESGAAQLDETPARTPEKDTTTLPVRLSPDPNKKHIF